MFAIIDDGGRQFRVKTGDQLNVDYRSGSDVGQSVALGRVLLANGGAGSIIGSPAIDGATVTAEVIVPEFKGKKIEIQKLRRRKNSRRHTGHRQKYTTVRVTAIDVPGLEVVESHESAD